MCTHAVLIGGGPGGSLSVAFSCDILAVSSLVIVAIAADNCNKAGVTALVFLLWRLLVAVAGCGDCSICLELDSKLCDSFVLFSFGFVILS